MMKHACLAMVLASTTLFSDTTPYCEKTVYEVGIDQITPLGFSAQDLLDLSSGRNYLDWGWDYKEGLTKLTLRTTTNVQSARYIDAEAVYPGGIPETPFNCPDSVEVDAWLTIQSDDGAFNERWFTKLFDTDGTDCMPETGDPCNPPGTEANFSYQFNRQSLNGNFYNEVHVPEDVTVDFYATGRFSETTTTANVYGQAYSCSDDICYTYFIHGGHTP